MKTGIIIGRFQLPYLHEGHKHLIETVRAENDLTFILIGCLPDCKTDDDRNPYTFSRRMKMITKEYPDVMWGVLMDQETDEDWSMLVDSILEQVENPTLYGSRDSFISHYKGRYPYKHVEQISNISGTQIREQLKNGK